MKIGAIIKDTRMPNDDARYYSMFIGERSGAAYAVYPMNGHIFLTGFCMGEIGDGKDVQIVGYANLKKLLGEEIAAEMEAVHG